AEVEVEAVRIEGPFRRGAQPQIVIHAFGGFAVRRVADAADPIQVRPRAHRPYFAEASGLDVLDRALVHRAATPLRAHLHDTVVGAHGLEHRTAFVDAGGQGLFDIYVFAGLAAVDGGQGVPMIG